MPRFISRTLTLLALVGLPFVDPLLVFASSAEIHPLQQSTLVEQCADRIQKWFSLITIHSQELDLKRGRIVLVADLVVIPLKKPQGKMRVIRWQQKALTDTLDLIRLLRERKIGAVNVLPFQQDPAPLYELRTNQLDELKGCQQKEHVREVLEQCTECIVRGWLDIKP